MRTYKERFLAACKKIAKEYRSKEGHHTSPIKCDMCQIYIKRHLVGACHHNEQCMDCPIAYKNTEDDRSFICTFNKTFRGRYNTETEKMISLLRAKFYEILRKKTEKLPAKYFRPSSGMKTLKEIVRKVDFYVAEMSLNQTL